MLPGPVQALPSEPGAITPAPGRRRHRQNPDGRHPFGPMAHARLGGVGVDEQPWLWAGQTVAHDGPAFRAAGRDRAAPSPGPPIWLGGWGPKAIERAATIADAPVQAERPTSSASSRCAGTTTRHSSPPAATRRRDRGPLPGRSGSPRPTRGAWDLAERHLLVNYRDEYGGGWSHPLVGAADATPIDRLDRLERAGSIMGSPGPVRRDPADRSRTAGRADLPPVLPGPAPRHAHGRDPAARRRRHPGLPLRWPIAIRPRRSPAGAAATGCRSSPA